jgi:hypothetical protein
MEYNSQCKVCGVTHSRRVDSRLKGIPRASLFTAPPPGAKRCFVVNFNPVSLIRQSLLDFLDTQPDVVNWLTSNALPGQVMVVSDRSCIEVARLIRTRFSGELFTVSTVSEIDGWMNQGYWDFVNAPKSSGRWDGLTPFTQPLLGFRPPGN